MAQVIDFKAFMDETGIDEELLVTLYQTFLEEITEENDNMINAYQNNDYDELTKIIHNIKGVLGSYRVTIAYDKATHLNSLVKQKEFNKLDLLIKDLSFEISRAVKEIENHFK